MDRRALAREYKDTPRPAGVFRVRNNALGKSLVGSSPNVPGALNRERFQLDLGSHPDRELQADWNELGPDVFEFETLDLLEPSEDPATDPTEDLEVLRRLWLDRLTASGEAMYPRSTRNV